MSSSPVQTNARMLTALQKAASKLKGQNGIEQGSAGRGLPTYDLWPCQGRQGSDTSLLAVWGLR